MKRLTIVTVLCVMTHVASAQIRLQSADQNLIRTSCGGAITQVERAYVVRDKETGGEYKREGLDYFGTARSVAIKVKGGLIVTQEAVMPWEYDSDFAEYKSKYEGVARQLMLEGGVLTIDSVEEVSVGTSDRKYYYIATDPMADGMGVEVERNGEVEGWVVIFVREKEGADTVVYRRAIEFKGEREYEFAAPMGIGEVEGGMYVRPEVKGIGKVEFFLCGVIRQERDKLVVTVPLIEGVEEGAKTERKGRGLVPVKTEPAKEELTPVEQTPIKKEKKKRK